MANYTKQDLYAVYAKHDREGLSELHEPGTDLDCAVCDEINRIAADLEGVSVEELVNSNSMDSSSTEEEGFAFPPIRMVPHVYKVSIDGNTYLGRERPKDNGIGCKSKPLRTIRPKYQPQST